MRLGSLPRGYVDPSSLASLYPVTSKPTLPDDFVAPDLRARNENAGAGAVVVGVAVMIGVGVWLSSRPKGRMR